MNYSTMGRPDSCQPPLPLLPPVLPPLDTLIVGGSAYRLMHAALGETTKVGRATEASLSDKAP